MDVTLEAQGSQPNFRYEIILPLMQGRVSIEGVTLKPSGPLDSAGYFENERFKNGDFGLLDTNWGDVVPAIDGGWDLICLPVFIKRKPVYNYAWVRADRDINGPMDLEGKKAATVGYASAISVYTRGFLQHHYGVDLHKLHWVLPGEGRFPLHDDKLQIEIAMGPRKSPVQRLLDGEVDLSTGDITDAKLWAALESTPQVKRLFPDYQEQTKRLYKEHGIFTPVHIILMGGKLHRANPGLARTLYDAFERSRELAREDALGDGSGPSMTIGNRELVRDQQREWGDVWKHGVSANKNTIETFLDYCHEQGMTKGRLPLDRVFAAETLDT